jgi:hypothetical protein
MLKIVKLSVIMLNVIVLSVIKLNVIILSVFLISVFALAEVEQDILTLYAYEPAEGSTEKVYKIIFEDSNRDVGKVL